MKCIYKIIFEFVKFGAQLLNLFIFFLNIIMDLRLMFFIQSQQCLCFYYNCYYIFCYFYCLFLFSNSKIRVITNRIRGNREREFKKKVWFFFMLLYMYNVPTYILFSNKFFEKLKKWTKVFQNMYNSSLAIMSRVETNWRTKW